MCTIQNLKETKNILFLFSFISHKLKLFGVLVSDFQDTYFEYFCLVIHGITYIYLHQWSVALLEAVVEGNLFEVNFTWFPESLLTLLLLTGEELSDVGVVTLSHILVPTLLHLVILHVINIFHLQCRNMNQDSRTSFFLIYFKTAVLK